MSVHPAYMSGVRGVQKRALDLRELELQLWDAMCVLETKPGLLEKKPVLLSAESFFQTHCFIFNLDDGYICIYAYERAYVMKLGQRS